jgi:hypothetical protein
MPFKKGTRPSTTARKAATSRGNMKKTTARGAYKNTKVSTMVKRNAPMKETKKRTQSAISTPSGSMPNGIPNGLTNSPVPVDSTYKIIIPWSACSYNQGVTDQDMIGTSLFSKYLKAKFEFTVNTITSTGRDVPGGNGFPSEIYLIHGWCTAPLNATNNSTPNVLGQVDRVAFAKHVEEQVKEYYDGENDQLSFDSKRRTSIKILSKRKLRVDRNSQLSLPQQVASGTEATSYFAVGTLAPINMSHTWKTMKKVHYTPGLTHPYMGQADTFFYPNWSWIPFSLIYQPNALSQEASQNIEFQYDNCHWYTDS